MKKKNKVINLKDHPEKLIAWAEGEIKEYQKFIRDIKKGLIKEN